MKKVLVACVGNILRGDDGFGVEVSRRLSDPPPGVEVIETGIGGMSVVHRLMDGFDGLVVVDAVDIGREPGTIVEIEPDVQDGTAMSASAWQALFSNLHLAEPSRVMALARAAGALPDRVLLVGCQVHSCEDFAPGLSPAVAAAVDPTARRVRALAAEMVAGGAL